MLKCFKIPFVNQAINLSFVLSPSQSKKTMNQKKWRG